MRRLLLIGGLLLSGFSASSQGASSPSSPLFPLNDPGVQGPVDYRKYGTFENVGTSNYRYEVKQPEELAKVLGIGIFPNEKSLERDPRYQEHVRNRDLEGPQSEFAPEADPELAFYKWGSLKGTPQKGLRLFNIARSLELAGHPAQALKAYYAAVVHYPKEVMWSDGRPWYVSVSALDAVYRLLAEHPEWERRLEGAYIDVKNGFDRKGTNDQFFVNPGAWKVGAPVALVEALKGDKRKLGSKDYQLVQRANGHWQFMVEGRPFVMRGLCYSPSPIGETPDWGRFKPHSDWMKADTNKNGLADGPYDSWVDENKNEERDDDEPVVGDFELMRRMGANTLRIYHHDQEEKMFRDLKQKFGIRVVMGDLLGAYTIGSGAEWETGTQYELAEQREKMKQSVQQMVKTHQDENYVVMWMLGNENNFGKGNNAHKNPAAYYQFVNSMAKMIKQMDRKKRPVALCNGELENLDTLSKLCPDVDVLAVNVYRGPNGMGESFWRATKTVWNKPVLISEFGCPAYSARHEVEDVEQFQAKYLLNNWKDIIAHAAGNGTGNALGGVIFEWVDEWWKAGSQYEAAIQDTEPQGRGPFVDGWMYEEWLGIASQGDGENSPFKRQLRQAYFAFKNGPWRQTIAKRLDKKPAKRQALR